MPEKDPELGPNGGMRLRSQVCRDLDCIAAQIKLVAAEKAKKVADAVVSISYISKKKCLLLEFMHNAIKFYHIINQFFAVLSTNH